MSAMATPRMYWDASGNRGDGIPLDSSSRPNNELVSQHNSRVGTRLGRFNAPAPFERDIKQSEKYERWLKWKTTFDVSLSICDGMPADHQKTGLLYTYVGDEVRDVIAMLSLPPMHNGRHCREGEYIELSKGLNDYFRTLVDATTDFARYTARKQISGESVHQFAIKLRDLALRVDVGHESIGFRHQFLTGLGNRPLARKATEEGLSIGQVIQQAGRIEQASEVEATKPWMDPNQQLAEIAAVSTRDWKKDLPMRSKEKRSLSRGSSSRPAKM